MGAPKNIRDQLQADASKFIGTVWALGSSSDGSRRSETAVQVIDLQNGKVLCVGMFVSPVKTRWIPTENMLDDLFNIDYVGTAEEISWVVPRRLACAKSAVALPELRIIEGISGSSVYFHRYGEVEDDIPTINYTPIHRFIDLWRLASPEDIGRIQALIHQRSVPVVTTEEAVEIPLDTENTPRVPVWDRLITEP